MHVFDNPYALFEQDRNDERGESRWHAGPPGRSEAVMSKLVRKTLADSPITPARKRKLAQLAERPDSEIDLSDIPLLKGSFWKDAIRNPFYRPVKRGRARATRPG
jgi:hypothetical protein